MPPAYSTTFSRFGHAGNSAPIRLYCFAHAGGTSATFAPWKRFLAPHLQVIGVETPGRGLRLTEMPLEELMAIAEDIVEHLEQELLVDDRPFAFYGHSLGAGIAFEVARALSVLGLPAPLHFFAGAARAPHLPPVQPLVSHLPQAEFLTAIQGRYGGIPQAVMAEPELLEMVLPAMRGDFLAYETYEHQVGAGLSCDITAFAGERDPIVRPEAVAGWADHTSGAFQHHVVPGDHFFLSESRERVLATILETCIAHNGLILAETNQRSATGSKQPATA